MAVPNGQFTVGLWFLETTATAAGQRLFSVSANGQPVLAALDLFASDGLAPTKRTFNLVVSTGILTLHFTTQTLAAQGTRSAFVNGIEIVPIPVTPPAPSGLTVLTGLLAERPANCPSGGIAFYVPYDTNDVFYCFRGRQWINADVLSSLTAMLLLGTTACSSGSVKASDLISTADNQTFVLLKGLDSKYRVVHALLREDEKFTGGSPTWKGLEVNLQTFDQQWIPWIPLGIGPFNSWFDRPGVPAQAPYDISLVVKTGQPAPTTDGSWISGGPLGNGTGSNFTNGKLYWELCGFRIP